MMRKQDELVNVEMTQEQLWAIVATSSMSSADKTTAHGKIVNGGRFFCQFSSVADELGIEHDEYEVAFPNKTQKALDQIAELQAQIEELKKTITD